MPFQSGVAAEATAGTFCSSPLGWHPAVMLAPPRDDDEYSPFSNQLSRFEQPKIRGSFLILTENSVCLSSMYSLPLKAVRLV